MRRRRRGRSHQGKSSMQKAKRNPGRGLPRRGRARTWKSRLPCLGFLGEFNAFQSEIKAKLQEQESRLAMLDRKSIAMNRPPLARAAETETPHKKAFAAYLRSGDDDGLRGLTVEEKALSTAVAADGGYLVDPMTAGADRRRAALVGLDPHHRQRGDGGGERLRRAGRPHRHRRGLGDRDRRRRPRPGRRRSTASRSRCTSSRRCRRRRSGCSTTAPSTSRAGWRSGSPTSSAAPRRRPSSPATASTSRRGS